MHFIWPHFLWSLALVLALPPLYLWLLRQRRRSPVTYPSLAIIRQALRASNRWRRHTPPALLWLALCVTAIGLARPTAQVTLPADFMTLVLAVDVSRSMLAEDVEPNRIQAAQATVKEFLQELPNNIRVGIVSFAGTAQVVQHITDERDALVSSIDRFQLQRGTATGSGLLLALETLLPGSGIDLQAAIYGEEFGRWGSKPLTPSKSAAAPATVAAPVPPGSYNNEQALQAMAKITEGEFFRAGNSQDLKEVYRHLSSKFSLERRDTEVTALFCMAALTLSVLALVLSILWFKRRT